MIGEAHESHPREQKSGEFRDSEKDRGVGVRPALPAPHLHVDLSAKVNGCTDWPISYLGLAWPEGLSSHPSHLEIKALTLRGRCSVSG